VGDLAAVLCNVGYGSGLVRKHFEHTVDSQKSALGWTEHYVTRVLDRVHCVEAEGKENKMAKID